MLSFPRRPEAFRRVAARYGDIASWVVGRQRFVLINHPDLIREAFITREEQFVKGWGPVLGNSVLGAGLITSEGAVHHRQRRLVLPAMHRGRLEEYAAAVLRHGTAMRDAWPRRASVTLLDEHRGVTLRVIGETVLGSDLSGEHERVQAMTEVVWKRFAGRMHGFGRWRRRLSDRTAMQTRDGFTELADRLIAARRAAPGRDLVSMLLEARDETGEPLPDQQLRDEVVTMIIAGHETVALTLTWAWHLLAAHPAAQEALHREVDEVLGSREPRWEDLKRLRVAESVIAETLRLKPAQWAMGRRAVVDVPLGGYVVPRGAIVLLCLPALHRDARWFESPEEFRIERWSQGVEKSARPFSYLPFGVGQRRCIGEGFAWMEATMLLALVAQRFRIASAPRVAEEPLLLLRPKANGPFVFESR